MEENCIPKTILNCRPQEKIIAGRQQMDNANDDAPVCGAYIHSGTSKNQTITIPVIAVLFVEHYRE
jgi:hypothetical protein